MVLLAVVDARIQGHQPEHVAQVERQLHGLPLVDVGRNVGVGSVDERRGRGYGYFLGHRTQLQRYILLGYLPDGEHDPVLCVGPETRHFNLKRVRPRRYQGESVVPVLPSGESPSETLVGIR